MSESQSLQSQSSEYLLSLYLSSEKLKQSFIIQALTLQFQSQTLTLPLLLQLSHPYFVNPDDSIRTQITSLLLELLKGVTIENHQELFQFFCKKCKDIPTLLPSVKILYLLIQTQNLSFYYTQLMDILGQESFEVPIYEYEIRKHFYLLILFLLKNNPDMCKNSQFLSMVQFQTDCEKDPRALILKFEIFSAVLSHFELNEGQLNQIYNDHLECYYPISFKNQKSDYAIDSKELELQLNSCMCHKKLLNKNLDNTLNQMEDDGNLIANLNTFIYVFQRYTVDQIPRRFIQNFQLKFLPFLQTNFMLFEALHEYLTFLLRNTNKGLHAVSHQLVHGLLKESLDFVKKVDILDSTMVYHIKVLQAISQQSIQFFLTIAQEYISLFIQNFQYQNQTSAVKYLDYLIQMFNTQIQGIDIKEQSSQIDFQPLSKKLNESFDLCKQDNIRILILKLFLQIQERQILSENNPIFTSVSYLYQNVSQDLFKNCILDFMCAAKSSDFLQDIQREIEQVDTFTEHQLYFIKKQIILQDDHVFNFYQSLSNSSKINKITQLFQKEIKKISLQNLQILFSCIQNICQSQGQLEEDLLKSIRKIVKHMLLTEQNPNIIQWMYSQLQNDKISPMVKKLFKYVTKKQTLTQFCQVDHLECYHVVYDENAHFLEQTFKNINQDNQILCAKLLYQFLRQNLKFELLYHLLENYDNLKNQISYEIVFSHLIPMKKQKIQVVEAKKEESSGCCGGSKQESSGGCCGGSKKQTSCCKKEEPVHKNTDVLYLQRMYHLCYDKIYQLIVKETNSQQKQALMSIILRILSQSHQNIINEVNIFDLIVQEMSIDNQNLKQNVNLLTKMIQGDRAIPENLEQQIFSSILDLLSHNSQGKHNNLDLVLVQSVIYCISLLMQKLTRVAQKHFKNQAISALNPYLSHNKRIIRKWASYTINNWHTL